jgi:hypothetical protein
MLNKEKNMTSDPSTRRTAIWVATLWIVTAIGAIGGLALMSPVMNAPDYLTSVFPRSATLISAALLWLVNDIGIIAIGVLMFPILKKQSESLALGYVAMRMFESIFLIVGMIFAMLLIPLSQATILAGAADVSPYQAIGSVLKQAQSWLMTVMQLVPLGLGGLILTILLFRGRLVPRWIAAVGIIGYGLLLPTALITLFGVFDTVPPAPGALLAFPVAIWEIIIMPIYLFARGFNAPAVSTKPGISPGKIAIQPATP